MATDFKVIAEMTKAISTPRMVTLCAPRRPMVLPNRPAMMAPASGASGTHSSVFWESVADIRPPAGPPWAPKGPLRGPWGPAPPRGAANECERGSCSSLETAVVFFADDARRDLARLDRHRLVDDALLLGVVAHLDMTRGREVLA